MHHDRQDAPSAHRTAQQRIRPPAGRRSAPLGYLTLGLVLLGTGCANKHVFAPPAAEQPYATMTVKFLNVRHEPGAAWGKKGFRPRLEICDADKAGCGDAWCYECAENGSEREWKISATSVGAVLHVPTRELTIVPYTKEGGDECRADPLVIAPKKGVDYELVYSHVWSGPKSGSYRCAASVDRKDAKATPTADSPDGEGGGPATDDTPEGPDGSAPESPAGG